METVAINFKGTGIKAMINKAEFDPAKHKLWELKDEIAMAAPLAVKPAAEVKQSHQHPDVVRQPKTKNAAK